jgi:hypothetical protein
MNTEERNLPTERRIAAVELLLSMGYNWNDGKWTAGEPAQVVAWYCTRRRGGGAPVFDEPFVATNPEYIKAHPQHDWKPLYTTPPAAAVGEDAKDAAANWRALMESVNADQVVRASEKFGDALGVLKDAARYRFLRYQTCPIDFTELRWKAEDEMDKYIDEAMTGESHD